MAKETEKVIERRRNSGEAVRYCQRGGNDNPHPQCNDCEACCPHFQCLRSEALCGCQRNVCSGRYCHAAIIDQIAVAFRQRLLDTISNGALAQSLCMLLPVA